MLGSLAMIYLNRSSKFTPIGAQTKGRPNKTRTQCLFRQTGNWNGDSMPWKLKVLGHAPHEMLSEKEHNTRCQDCLGAGVVFMSFVISAVYKLLTMELSQVAKLQIHPSKQTFWNKRYFPNGWMVEVFIMIQATVFSESRISLRCFQ